MIQDEFSRPYSNGAKNGAVEIQRKSPYSLVIPNTHPQLRLGRYPTTRGSGRMSLRRRNKFLFAGFGWISVTRLLSLQSKTEKRTGIFCTKQPLCAVFYGGFLLFEAVRSRNLAAGTEKSGPRKRNSRPRKFFSKPRIFQPAAWKPFFPLLGTFSPTNPRCQYVGTSPARLTCPGNPGAETSRTRDIKKACALYLPTFGFPHVPRDCVFCARHRPLPRTSESQGLQMTKCQIPGEIAKCQIRRGVSAGKHETVPRYISTVQI